MVKLNLQKNVETCKYCPRIFATLTCD